MEGLRNESRLREKGRDLMHGRSKSSGSGFGFGLGKNKGTPHRATGSASGLLGVPMTPDGRGLSGQQPNSAPGGLHAGDQGEGRDEEEGDEDAEESEEARKKKDQALSSRLRRVKSLFNTKGSRLKKGSGTSASPSPGPAGAATAPNSPRPETSMSTRTTGTTGTTGTAGDSPNTPTE